MRDYQFRMKLSRFFYEKAWQACAKTYGRKDLKVLSDDGSEAFDAFSIGYKRGYEAGMRRRKTK